jgi:hypothetical protein
VTYSSPEVQAFIAQHFIPVRVMLNRTEDQQHFRAYQVVWTPTIVITDRRGVAHYHAPGYLPPDLFLSMANIGLARSMIAWARYDEAAKHLATVAHDEGSSLAPEALYWLGVARYLKERRRAPMMEAWNKLKADYPTSVWAARVPPNQEELDEP